MGTYTTEQKNFITYDGESSIILSATAGSGKTHSTVGRLNHMIEQGVDPKDMIFFSFTNDAVNELRSRIKHDVKITTIHSFTSSLLGKLGLYKPIVTFFDFANWYRDKFKPTNRTPMKLKMEYGKTVERFYEEGAAISATFSAYRLQTADGIRVLKPAFFDYYMQYLKETKSRDFSDLLIDTERLTRNEKYKSFFEGMYKYVFVDEYQDTSSLQMKILLAIKAKQYHLIGDPNQCIVEGSKIHTNDGYVDVSDLKINDLLITGGGSGTIKTEHVKNIKVSNYSGDIIRITTKSGKTIETTPNHTHFANFSFDNENRFLVYLMYKKGFGFRIGKTEIYPKRKIDNNSDRFGFKFRLNQENADKIWIIKSYDNLDDALVNEDYFSLKYQIPKTVFKARTSQNQNNINKLFSMIDTESNGYKLLKELYYDIKQPHFVPRTNSKDYTNVCITLCSDGRYKKTSHNIEINTSNEYIKNYFESNGYKFTDNGKHNGWRYRKQTNDYSKLMDIINLRSDSINLVFKTKLINKTYNQMPASQVLSGMSFMVLDPLGNIATEEILSSEIIYKDNIKVYDLDVTNTHNLVVNRIFTHNSIYGFSGASCDAIEDLLISKMKVIKMTLTTNFRSHRKIVENSNLYSTLTAVAHHKEEGYVHGKLIDVTDLQLMLTDGKPLTVLARTNNVIRSIELDNLKKKVKMRYFNYITPTDIENYKKNKITPTLRKRIDAITPYFKTAQNLFTFIEENSQSDVFITTIHKSKGREFPRCVIINSIDPQTLDDEDASDFSEYSFIREDGSIDIEARNVHYVAVTRPKEELYFLVY